MGQEPGPPISVNICLQGLSSSALGTTCRQHLDVISGGIRPSSVGDTVWAATRGGPGPTILWEQNGSSTWQTNAIPS